MRIERWNLEQVSNPVKQVKTKPQAYQVFLSSTFLDLAAERKAVRDALTELNLPLSSIGVCLFPVDLQAGAESQPPIDACLEHLAGCDLVVTLVGHRAGWLTPDGRSITEREFEHARSNNIPCLAYVRDNATPVLPEFVDKDEKQVAVLDRFKRTIDACIKRDTFRSAEQLRGHILRDILYWILNQPNVKERIAEHEKSNGLAELKNYLDVIKGSDIRAAVATAVSHRFATDMRRFGTDSIRRELLCDLLELGSLTPPTRLRLKTRLGRTVSNRAESPPASTCRGS